MSPDTACHVQRQVALREGTPAEQKDKLVDFILGCFQDPSKWPLTDTERSEVLRSLYSMAINIRKSEQ